MNKLMKRGLALLMGFVAVTGGAALLDGAEFLRVTEVRDLRFPADHGGHPGYALEWWYYTGALQGEGGERYGYQLTFFRVQLSPEELRRESRWATREVLFAHFALTDVNGRKFRYQQVTGRPVLGLAGYSTDTLDVAIGDWYARLDGKDILLRADGEDFAIDFRLTPTRPPLFHGDRGLSQKGEEAGNANYYYSFTRLKTEGRLTVEGRQIRVTGMSWMDQEWGSSNLAPNQRGWDWFSLRLSDGRDLMLFQIRDEEQNGVYFSGTLGDENGAVRTFGKGDFSITATGFWTSRRSGARYPSGWRLEVPDAGIDIEITPELADQELNTAGTTGVTYWEGLVSGSGKSGGRPVQAEGYVELTGYAPDGSGPPGAGSSALVIERERAGEGRKGE